MNAPDISRRIARTKQDLCYFMRFIFRERFNGRR